MGFLRGVLAVGIVTGLLPMAAVAMLKAITGWGL